MGLTGPIAKAPPMMLIQIQATGDPGELPDHPAINAPRSCECA